MEDISSKLSKIEEDIVEIKIAAIKLESHYNHSNVTLDKLSESVIHHIKRTDALESIVLETKTQQELQKRDFDNLLNNFKLAYTILATLGLILLGLEQLGILDKLF